MNYQIYYQNSVDTIAIIFVNESVGFNVAYYSIM